jgi:hypothetical protein
MSGNLVFRPLIEEDYETICKWWEGWKWPVVARELLPNDGTGGFMVEKNGQPIVCGFIYLTNSKGAWLEFIVSDPNYKDKDRHSAIELLISGAEKFCIDLGFKVMLFVGKSKGLINKFKKLGWFVDETPSYEIMKTIQ